MLRNTDTYISLYFVVISTNREQNIPVVLRGWTEDWGAHTRWTCERFIDPRLRNEKLEVFDEHTGPIDINLAEYVTYAQKCTGSERPLYMFEPWYIEKVPEFGDDYTVPAAFRDDLFAVLGDKRPDFRWLLMGPRGSGMFSVNFNEIKG